MGKLNQETNKILIQFLLAIFTAILSTIGFYFTSKIQAKNEKEQKKYENKINAYQSFLASIGRNQSPIIAEILNIGELSKKVSTDPDIQNLENNFEKLISINDDYKISWQLDSDFSILRMYGSENVRQNCDDILSVLALDESSVNWQKYPLELQKYHKEILHANENGIAYGYESKVNSDERVKFILLSALYKNLLDQLRIEIQQN